MVTSYLAKKQQKTKLPKWDEKLSNVCRPIKQANKQTSKPDSNTDHYQSWMLPMTDSKITLDTGSVMRISCPGFGFQHGDLSASQFWTTKYVIPPKTQFQKQSLFKTSKNGLPIIMLKSSSKNISNENKHLCSSLSTRHNMN